MGKERVEAQTDGGLFIDVPNPIAQTKVHERLVWTRSYYVLPLEVVSILNVALFASVLLGDAFCCSQGLTHRPNARPA